MRNRWFAALVIGVVMIGNLFTADPSAYPQGKPQDTQAARMNGIAERYVKLVLALGQHDADYVDAYYGPPEWKKEAESGKVALDDLASRTRTLLDDLAASAGTHWRDGDAAACSISTASSPRWARGSAC